MTQDNPKTRTLSFRLSEDAYRMLKDAATVGSYQITKTSIVERGIELACNELCELGVLKRLPK